MNKDFTKNITARYTLALGIIAALSITAYFVQYENEHNERNARLQRIETGVLGFTLFVLLLEALLVFKPMARRIKHAASKIMESELRTRSMVDGAWD